MMALILLAVFGVIVVFICSSVSLRISKQKVNQGSCSKAGAEIVQDSFEGKALFRNRIASSMGTAALAILAAAIGLAVFLFLPYVIPNCIKIVSKSPVFPMLTTALNNMVFVPTIILIFSVGCVFGFIKPRMWWLFGLVTTATLPLAMVIEIIKSPTSHNLWPIEVIFYALLSLPSIGGSLLGSRYRLARSSNGK